MAHKSALECTDQLFRTITGEDIPFGGKVFLGIGDFRQVALVIRGAGKTETFGASSLLYMAAFLPPQAPCSGTKCIRPRIC